MHYRLCLVAACVLATAITVRASGAISFGTPSQSTSQTSGSKPTPTQTAGQKPASAPAAAGGYVGTANAHGAVGSNGGSLYKIELATGAIAATFDWAIQPQDKWTWWSTETGGEIFWDARTAGVNRPLGSPS